jgi:hypothetical protein
MKIFKKVEFKKCIEIAPLTSIEQDFERDFARIILHTELIPKYLYWFHNHLTCCYREIFRSGQNASADNEYRLSECQYFDESIELPKTVENLLVFCYSERKGALLGLKINVYQNAHALIRRKSVEPKRNPSQHLKVMLIGIDGISRLNLMRAMPSTAKHLHESGWFELQGYSKVEDNTLPNFFAMLAGINYPLYYEQCDIRTVGGLDKCKMMWHQYEREGFVTAYAEDDMYLTTFNFYKTGFVKQPTTHYFRPFALAAEKYLKIQKKHRFLTYCLGHQHYVDYIYKYMLDFGSVYKNQSHFGLFWSNSFSHEDLSEPSAMDEKTREFLTDLQKRGILNDSIIFFFSDHGTRFGPILKTITGWYENRLPFMFIWLPAWFQEKYSQFVTNLKVNRNRLTNTFDLHMTLQHLLELSGRSPNLTRPAESCPECRSFFEEVPEDRTCEDAAIDSHWCTCTPFQDIDGNSKIVRQVIDFVIDFLNNFISQHGRSEDGKSLCATLSLKEILQSRISIIKSDSPINYLVSFVTRPVDAELEATVRYWSETNKFELIGSVSRLDRYGNQSACIKTNKELKKYCSCI